MDPRIINTNTVPCTALELPYYPFYPYFCNDNPHFMFYGWKNGIIHYQYSNIEAPVQIAPPHKV